MEVIVRLTRLVYLAVGWDRQRVLSRSAVECEVDCLDIGARLQGLGTRSGNEAEAQERKSELHVDIYICDNCSWIILAGLFVLRNSSTMKSGKSFFIYFRILPPDRQKRCNRSQEVLRFEPALLPTLTAPSLPSRLISRSTGRRIRVRTCYTQDGPKWTEHEERQSSWQKHILLFFS